MPDIYKPTQKKGNRSVGDDRIEEGSRGDRESAMKRMLDNGIGQRLSRIMIIIGFPLISALAAYAWNLTIDGLKSSNIDLAREIRQVSKALADVSNDGKQTKEQLSALRVDVTRLQDAQQNFAERFNDKRK